MTFRIAHEPFENNDIEGTITILSNDDLDVSLGLGPSVDDENCVRFGIAEHGDVIGLDMSIEELDQLIDELIDARDNAREYTWEDIEEDLSVVREALIDYDPELERLLAEEAEINARVRGEREPRRHKFEFVTDPDNANTNDRHRIVVPIDVSEVEQMLAETREGDVLELHIPIG